MFYLISVMTNFHVQLKQARKKKKTLANYESYLKPWVKWLLDPQQAGVKMIDSHLLKRYLDSKFTTKSVRSYKRVGS